MVPAPHLGFVPTGQVQEEDGGLMVERAWVLDRGEPSVTGLQ